jgi:hypothetical protein
VSGHADAVAKYETHERLDLEHAFGRDAADLAVSRHKHGGWRSADPVCLY